MFKRKNPVSDVEYSKCKKFHSKTKYMDKNATHRSDTKTVVPRRLVPLKYTFRDLLLSMIVFRIGFGIQEYMIFYLKRQYLLNPTIHYFDGQKLISIFCF